MCVDNYPIWNLAEQMHQTINESVQQYFDGAIINCMDMTADAYFNFGSTAIARGAELRWKAGNCLSKFTNAD